jgi:hypothetical protein
VTTEIATAVLLIGVPIAFNLPFFELGRAFDYIAWSIWLIALGLFLLV